jgi:hypothetical protein
MSNPNQPTHKHRGAFKRAVDAGLVIPEIAQIAGATKPVASELSPLELNRIISLSEAARLSSLSEDTIRREHSDKILDLSPRRRGMRVGDALMLTTSS